MRKILMTTTAVIACAMPAAVMAQDTSVLATASATDSNYSIDDIIVTAQKRSENLQDIPLSITAVSGEIIEKAGISNAVELSRLLPTMTIYSAFQRAALTIRIRGFGSDPAGATDADVASYIDGVFVPRPGAIMSSFLDVSTVEALAGPQGTLFGRNAAMGAISINTNEPSVTNQSFRFVAEGGRFNNFSGTAVANIPLSEKFAVRVAAKASTTDGQFYNLLDRKRYGQSDNLIGRISFKAELSDALSWVVRADAAKIDGDGVNPFIVYTKTATPTALANFTNFITRNGGTPLVYSAPGKFSYTVNQFMTADPSQDDKQWGVSSHLNWDVTSDLSLRMISSYRDWDSKQQSTDSIATSLDLINLNFGWDSEAQSHELQLVSSKGAFLDGKLGVTAGLYYFDEDYETFSQFNLGSQFCNVVFGSLAPPLVPACNAGPRIGAGRANLVQSTRSYAGYLQFNYQIIPSVQIDLGIRQTSDRKRGIYTGVTPNALGVGQIIRAEGPTPLRFKDNNTSWRASLSWNITDRIMAFATYSTGYKSGGFNASGSSPALTPAARVFGSQTVDDLELGFKSTLFDGRARLNATFFDTKLNNFQDRSFNGTSFLVRNSGDVKSRGVDVDGRVLVTPSINFTYGVTYLDSKYKNAIGAPGLEGCTGTPACPSVQDLSGQRISFAPKWKGNVGVEWRSGPILGEYSMGVSVSESFMSSIITANTNNPQTRVSGYSTTDARLSFYSPGENWQLDFFGSNIFDKRYLVITSTQVLGGPIGLNDPATGSALFRGFLGEPARYGVRVSTKF